MRIRTPAARYRKTATAVALAACAAMAGLGACGDGKATPRRARTPAHAASSIDDVVRWRGAVALEENRKVINVFPQVSFAPGGDFLVADGREAQIRVYGADGRLRRWFGSHGEGPAEFTRPATALAQDHGRVLVVDLTGKYAVFDSAGARVASTGRMPVQPVYAAREMGDGQLLLVGRGSGVGSPYLHVWDPRRQRIVRSFFVPPVRPGLEDEAIVAGTMDAAVRGDSIAAMFALSDSIFLFTRGGARIGALPLRARGFRPLTTHFRGGGLGALKQWNESHSIPGRVFWLPDGSFLAQYSDMVGNEQRFTLVRLGRDGEPIFEVAGTPRLLAVSPGGETLVFVKPGAETPNEWAFATLR
jgi:hypothetical protein